MGGEFFIDDIKRARDVCRGEMSWLGVLREAAAECFTRAGLPSTSDEEWKYTNVAGVGLEPYASSSVETVELDDSRYRIEGADLLFFVDGHLRRDRCRMRALSPGARVGGLAERLAADPEALEPYLGQVAAIDGAPFSALNLALAEDGALIQLDAGVRLPRPLQLVFLTGSDNVASHPRNLIIAGRGAEATIFETYLGATDARYLTNTVTEVVVGEDARVEHHKLQVEGAGAYHLATIAARQRRGSRFLSSSFSLGAKLARNDITSLLGGEGAECIFNGLFIAGGEQHVDHHTVADHQAPGCQSRELYKGILGDRAKGVFNGKVFVRAGAQRTNAIQSNRNLLLSEDATINTKPQLEIFADDVRCTHGATVGQLDEDALFYLRTRGLSAGDARNVLVEAFADEVVSTLTSSLREHVQARLQVVLPAMLRGEGGEPV